MNDPQRLGYLFRQYYNDQLTEEEHSEFSGIVKDLSEAEISDLMKKAWDENANSKNFFSAEVSRRMLAKILNKNTVPVRRMVWVRVAAAAIVIFMALGAYFILNKDKGVKPVAKEKVQKDILPGHDGAILTLADGRTIILDNAKDGKITDVAVKNGNKVSYQNSAQTKVEYNTMTTPKGRQFSLVLPDGTQVWLNAASSITYPTAFVGNERKVSITGEAYFEVAHNASKPFHVNVNGADVQVLGTHFNINSYSNEEELKVTLLEGSVRVSSLTANGQHLMAKIRPGEQAAITRNAQLVTRNNIDVDAAVAWKNGFFQFSGMGIESVMRQLERWYDIDVRYEGKIPDRQFAGQIDRSATLSQVLKILQESNVHFKLDNRTLVVTP